MDIVNDTDQDAKVRVAGGGGGVAPHGRSLDDEETTGWPVLPSGSILQHSPPYPGPWTVCFVVNGRRVITETRSASSVVRLTPAGRTFKVNVD